MLTSNTGIHRQEKNGVGNNRKPLMTSVVVLLIVIKSIVFSLSVLWAQNPISSEDLMESALEAYFNDRFDESIGDYRKALEIDPNNEFAKKGLENAQLQKKRRLKKLQAQERKNMNAVEDSLANENWVEAHEGVMDVLSRVPDHPDALLLKDLIRVKVERELESCRPASARWSEIQGDLAYIQGDWEKAVYNWQRILDLHPKRTDLLSRLDRAKAHEAIQQRLDRIASLADLARVCQREGRFSDARDHWQELLGLDPDNLIAQEGLKRAQTALQEDWQTEREEKIQNLQVRAIDAMSDGKREESLRLWKEIIELDPNNVLARDHLQRNHIPFGADAPPPGISRSQDSVSRAADYIRTQRYVEASELLERQLIRSPGDARAEEMLKEVRAKQTQSVDLLYKEGLGFYAKGLKHQAIQKWQEALRLNPDFVRAKQALVKTMQEVGDK
jgi:tetratricopeptide (TPR) repeat protein